MVVFRLYSGAGLRRIVCFDVACSDYASPLYIMRHEGMDTMVDDACAAQGGWSIVQCISEIFNSSKKGKGAQKPKTLMTKA